MQIITILTTIILLIISHTAIAQAESKIYLPYVSSPALDYVAETPAANRPTAATLQVDVFDQCGDCGAGHRLPGVLVEISYTKGGYFYATTVLTDWEGVVKFYEPYETLTLRILADPLNMQVVSSIVTVSRLQTDTSQPPVGRWGVTFKRRY